jgi:hypothetical protein
MQVSERQAGAARLVGGVREAARFRCIDLDERMQLGVPAIDARQMRVDDFAARAAPFAQKRCLRAQRQIGKFDFFSPRKKPECRGGAPRLSTRVPNLQ